MQPQRRRQPGYGIFLLAYQVFGVIGVQYIPPVTLCLVGLQAAIYLRLFRLPWYRSSDICVSAYSVWYKGDHRRLLYAAFEHADDMHLYYNMVSFILKGQALERRFGGPKFLYLTTMFAVLTNMVLVGLSVFASDYDYNYVSQCAVGFSGVIFALKVLTSYYFPNNSHHIMGIPVFMPASKVVWIELILIQLLVPNASFMGHLAGILVGLAYIKGPLRPILDGSYSLLNSIISGFTYHPPPSTRFTSRAEATGYRTPRRQSNLHSNYDLDEDEQIRLATEASLRMNSQRARPNSPSSSSSNIYPNINEIRDRRRGHFGL